MPKMYFENLLMKIIKNYADLNKIELTYDQAWELSKLIEKVSKAKGK